MSQPTLFDDSPDLLHGTPTTVVATCHTCGAHTAPTGPDAIPLTNDGDPGAPWTGVTWAAVTLASHRRECPGPPATDQEHQ